MCDNRVRSLYSYKIFTLLVITSSVALLFEIKILFIIGTFCLLCYRGYDYSLLCGGGSRSFDLQKVEKFPLSAITKIKLRC